MPGPGLEPISMHKPVGVVGATGAVGKEMISVLHARGEKTVPRLFGSRGGREQQTEYGTLPIEEFSLEAVRECRVVLMAVSGSFALEWAKKICEEGGPPVVDNSSAFRYDPDLPLCVPEVNAHVLDGGASLVANPNCTTAIAVMALWPIHKACKIKKMIVSSYQAASGAGKEGMQELEDGCKAHVAGEPVPHSVFAHPLAMNVIPHIDAFQENGYTKEEMKVCWETRKLFGDPDLLVSSTCVRVPTLRAHAEAITIECEKPIPVALAKELIAKAPGVQLVDDPEQKQYPMPKNAAGKYDVEVGRLRQSIVFGEHGLDLFVCGDQLLRGAALNAVLIAEELHQ